MGIIADHEEILDLVNDKEEVVGQISHEDAYDPQNLGGYFLRASNVFIVNDQGQLWIPRRTAEKRIAPNGLDYSAGEHAQAGEPYSHAAARGLAEELNITAAEEDLIYIGKTTPQPGRPPYFAANYIYLHNESPDYNPDDFVGYEWLLPEDLIKRLTGGTETAKDSLIDSARLFLEYKAKNTSN